ncbi:MAG: DUF2141 domain-containing protein [bacterium]|jgi:uncharacterized protein (DUF2141 family)
MKQVLLIASSVAASALSHSASAADVTVQLTDVRPGGGQIRAVLCVAGEDFPNSCKRTNVTPAMAGTTQVVFKDVAPGSYAFAAYRDANGNGKLDLAGGIPKESIAFSNNAMGRQGVPSFSASVFQVGQTGAQLTIKMRRIGAR